MRGSYILNCEVSYKPCAHSLSAPRPEYPAEERKCPRKRFHLHITRSLSFCVKNDLTGRIPVRFCRIWVKMRSHGKPLEATTSYQNLFCWKIRFSTVFEWNPKLPVKIQSTSGTLRGYLCERREKLSSVNLYFISKRSISFVKQEWKNTYIPDLQSTSGFLRVLFLAFAPAFLLGLFLVRPKPIFILLNYYIIQKTLLAYHTCILIF